MRFQTLKIIKMKKLFIAAIAVITFGANAQDVNFKSKRGENMLPEKGDWAIGFNTDGVFRYLGNSFNGNVANNAPTVSFVKERENAFVGKYFTSDKSAYRVVFNFRAESQVEKRENTTPDPFTTTTTVPVTPTPNSQQTIIDKFEDKESSTEFALGFGKEWRRGKTRLQGFYGADILLLVSSNSNSVNTFKETTEVTVTPASTEKTISDDTIDFKSGVGLGFGAEGFIGAEYFLFPKIAIGAQYTYSLRFTNVKGGTTTTTNFDSNELSTRNPVLISNQTTQSVNGLGRVNSGFAGVGIVSMNLTLHF